VIYFFSKNSLGSDGEGKKQPRTAETVGATVISCGEINLNKITEQIVLFQDLRFNFPETLPRLVAGREGFFLDYSGLRIPATAEQARCHLACLQQYLQEVAYDS
jgi:hypothetical protein